MFRLKIPIVNLISANIYSFKVYIGFTYVCSFCKGVIGLLLYSIQGYRHKKDFKDDLELNKTTLKTTGTK